MVGSCTIRYFYISGVLVHTLRFFHLNDNNINKKKTTSNPAHVLKSFLIYDTLLYSHNQLSNGLMLQGPLQYIPIGATLDLHSLLQVS